MLNGFAWQRGIQRQIDCLSPKIQQKKKKNVKPVGMQHLWKGESSLKSLAALNPLLKSSLPPENPQRA